MPIEAKLGDVIAAKVDVLILKYADGFRGADLAVAGKLGLLAMKLQPGAYKFVSTDGKIAPREILLMGVGSLRDFDYSQINKFAETTINIVALERPQACSVGITVHGPNYGLDELAAIASLVDGIRRAFVMKYAKSKTVIEIIEFDPKRYMKLNGFLSENAVEQQSAFNSGFSPDAARAISSGGTYERRLFAAMPFKDKFLDHWDFALQPAAHANNVVIERLDHEHFVGEILAEIRVRIERASAVVAILDENNPNVFLEVGYAWGIRKPTLLALHADNNPPFDVSGHKLIRYKRLGDLRLQLEIGLKGLLQNQAI